MIKMEERINVLFKELVPVCGKADTVAGEIVRAISRICYRNYNDGDHIGVGYGKETCNPAARYLIAKIGDRVERIIYNMWGIENNKRYDEMMTTLKVEVLAYLEQHPELKTTINSEDMRDYRNKNEDIDDIED